MDAASHDAAQGGEAARARAVEDAGKDSVAAKEMERKGEPPPAKRTFEPKRFAAAAHERAEQEPQPGHEVFRRRRDRNHTASLSGTSRGVEQDEHIESMPNARRERWTVCSGKAYARTLTALKAVVLLLAAGRNRSAECDALDKLD